MLSDFSGWAFVGGQRGVSIPRSGFCAFRLPCSEKARKGRVSFNPSVGILCFQTASDSTTAPMFCCFNPSVGILCFQTSTAIKSKGQDYTFQSLGRDSVLSDRGNSDVYETFTNVSIPRSGFCAFRHRVGPREVVTSFRFNPSVGILCFQTKVMTGNIKEARCFNPSVGILCFQTIWVSVFRST